MKSAVIYLRTSTEEQKPENQLKECEELALRHNLSDYEILQEEKSAFKDDRLRVRFNEILAGIQKREIKNLICWDLDRLYRNRKKLVAFFELCRIKGCKVHSSRQKFLEDINNAPEPWNEILRSLMISILGWMAEDESQKKSERVRAAIRLKEDGAYSYKGNKWGRKMLTTQAKNRIIELHKEGKSYRDICKEVTWDNGKNVGLGSVHKTLQEWKVNKPCILSEPFSEK